MNATSVNANPASKIHAPLVMFEAEDNYCEGKNHQRYPHYAQYGIKITNETRDSDLLT